MKKHEQYLEVLKTFDDFATLKEWAIRFIETYPNDSKDEDKVKIRKVEKSISSLLSTGKWSGLLLIDKKTKPQKIKLITKDNSEISETQHIAKSTKGVKSINFKLLMNDLKYFSNDELLNRDRYSHFENNVDFIGYREYIAFEMARRNKNVTTISQKLDYIDKIIEKYPCSDDFRNWFRGIEDWEYKFAGDPPELIVNSEQKKKYIVIAKLPISEFMQEIDFLNIKECSNEKTEDVISLKIMADYLQDELIKNYHIYKDGYYFIKDNNYFDPYEVIDLDSTFKYNFNTYPLEDELKSVIDTLINRKAENMKQTADMFFMYDYYQSRKQDDNLIFYAQDLKFELTKYHGIKIEGFDERFSYDYCLKHYEKFKNLNASFYVVERTISDKIEIMKKFIDQELYKYILFY